MPDLQTLLGKTVLLCQDGSKVETSTFAKEGHVVGLYFSAHWCPPCRNFTPVLAEFYKKVRESKQNKFEIVFISSDRDVESFKEYFGMMPWKALAYDQSDKKDELTGHFEIQGIPALIFVKGDTGEVVETQGRKLVMADPEGKNLPF